MEVTRMEKSGTSVTTASDVVASELHDESSDDEQSEEWGANECDWRMSSSSEPARRFSLVELPIKVRDSVFRRGSKPQTKVKERSSTMDTTRTSSSGSTPRDSELFPKPRPDLEQVETFRRFWDEKLCMALERLAARNLKHVEATTDVFYVLLKLYAHQDVIQDLYSTYDANAAAFEFYIPQLCTLLLHGNHPKQQQFECFLMSKSGDSLPFAHRLTWFLRSFCDNATAYHSEYLSLTASSKHEHSDLLSAISMRAGVPALRMHRGLCAQEVSATRLHNLQQRRSSELDSTRLESDVALASQLLGKLNALQHDARLAEGNTQQTQLVQQTPKFVEALTDLADELIRTPRAQRNTHLRKGLTAIEAQMLPSDVIYLPVGNSYHRVQTIQVDECFTFSTKERVPYFLCLEVLDYSVSSSTKVSKTQRKRRRLKASCNQSRGFSLRLPFKNTVAEPIVPGDHSPVSSSTYSESEPSPTSLEAVDQCKDMVTLAHLNGEDNDKENSKQRAFKSTQASTECVLDGEDRQERLGQWNLPRSHGCNSKKYALRASTQSGDKFDSFYSSWCSKMAEQDVDGELHDCQMHHMPQSQVTCCHEDEMNENLAASSSQALEPAFSDSRKVFAVSLRRIANLSLEASSSHDERQPNWHLETASIENESAEVGSPKLELAAASALKAKRAHRFSIFSKKPTDVPTPASISAEASVVGYETSKQNRTMFAAIFANKLQEKAEMSATVSVSPLTSSSTVLSDHLSKMNRGNVKALEFMDKDIATSASLQKPNAARVSVVLEAEEGDAEDTDSNGCLFSDEDSCVHEPEPSPARQPAASFVSLFFRKPGPVLVEAKTEEVTTAAEGVALPRSSACVQETGTCEPRAIKDIFDGQNHSNSEKRQRDLSLDFADPSAWKERFDLEDCLMNDVLDSELTDIDAVEDTADEEIHESCGDEKPMIVFREQWSEKEARIRRESPLGDHPGWRLLSVIVKSNDDLRQEQFAAQLIAQCDRIFREYSLPLSLRPYNVIATSATTGLIEAVPDTVSLDSLKRNDPGYTSLLDFYTRFHGDKASAKFARAQRNFVESLAAYSIVCYVFQIKDRHNGNILVDTDGHVIHIDFGFLLTNSPGSNWNFERAPFKLTDEFVELMGGPRSSTFRYFRSLCIRAYLALRRNLDQIVLLVEMMLVGNADLPCFAGGKKAVIESLRARLKPGARTSACQVFVNQLIDQSINNWRTRWYDKYQRACLGIL